MIREWKANNGVSICGLLIDTLVKIFLDENITYRWFSKSEYCDLITNVFKYFSEQSEEQKQWYALGSNQLILNKNFNFVKKSKKSYNELFNADDKLSKLREIFGNRFPISEKAANEYGFSNNEQFIEELYPIYITSDLKIDCEITQSGFRPAMLSEFIRNHYKIKQNRKLKFIITNCNVLKPYDIYWKVRNVGSEAIKRSCIRGQIIKGTETQNETANFFGPHYVECFIVKNGICVARDKIIVNIDYN